MVECSTEDFREEVMRGYVISNLSCNTLRLSETGILDIIRLLCLFLWLMRNLHETVCTKNADKLTSEISVWYQMCTDALYSLKLTWTQTLWCLRQILIWSVPYAAVASGLDEMCVTCSQIHCAPPTSCLWTYRNAHLFMLCSPKVQLC